MKKAVFTIQMIVLMAFFPVYLVAELNQKTGSQPDHNAASAFTEKAEEKNVQPVLNPEAKGFLFVLPETGVIN